MQTIQSPSPGANGMTYENAPTCENFKVLQWYASVTSSLDTLTGPWTGSSSQSSRWMRGGGPPQLQQLRRGLPVGGNVDAGHS